MINLKLINGPRYIESILKKIELVKDLFLMDLELGEEVIIPRELSMDQLPQSYRYYDYILLMVQEKATQDRRQFSHMKAKLNNMFDEKLSLKNTLGYGYLIEKLNGNNKKLIISKNSKIQIEEIDHNKSRHTSEVQRSKYIAMNDGVFDEEENGMQ